MAITGASGSYDLYFFEARRGAEFLDRFIASRAEELAKRRWGLARALANPRMTVVIECASPSRRGQFQPLASVSVCVPGGG